MVLAFNSGLDYQVPTIDFTYPMGIITFGAYHYRRNSPAAVFHALQFAKEECDSRGSIGSAAGVYSMCQALHYPHEASYYESGEGRTYINTINQYAGWIYGGIKTGGLALVKLNSDNYGFICYSGILKEDEGSNYVYGYTSPTFYYEGEQGSLSEMELYRSFIAMTNLGDGLYVFYQPDHYQTFFTESYSPIVAATVLTGWQYGELSWAAASSKWFLDQSLVPWPYNAWEIVDEYNNWVLGKGYFQVALQYTREGYSLVDGSWDGGAELNLYDDPYANAGEPGDSGSGGSYDNNSDDIDFTDPDEQFDIDGINSGFYTLYNPTKSQIQAFNDFLFQDIDDTLSQQLKRLVANPLDYVLFIAMCHFHPNIQNSDAEIQFCGIGSGVSSHVISKQMQEIDCGYIYLDESQECGGFLSYNPYTQIQCNLPYVGIVDLNTDDVMGAYIGIKYFVDLMTGSCLVQIKANRDKRPDSNSDSDLNSIIGEYSGNVYQNMPISATDWRGLFQSVIQFAGGLIQAGGGNVIGGVASAANAVMADKISVSKSGKLGANYGYMGNQIPYLIISRPVPAMPNGFSHREGLPTYKVGKVSDFSGYCEIDTDTLWTDNFTGITSEEASMLKSICNTGIHVAVSR